MPWCLRPYTAIPYSLQYGSHSGAVMSRRIMKLKMYLLPMSMREKFKHYTLIKFYNYRNAVSMPYLTVPDRGMDSL